MLKDTLLTLFKRDLNILIAEINLYKEETNLWKVEGLITNSPGSLCLHLVGNLNHFIGTVLGDTGYVRQRELEFSLKDVPKSILVKAIKETMDMLEGTLKKLTEEDFQKDYKINLFVAPVTTEYFLVHLAMHLSYHLGQINYHRRLLD